ncbi:TIGR00730 family Rossman fold protein [Streptobacillus felis]|uniref:Cytokinin riboside 5'-monophosphate phosphoribohydrolase n=1 Tax=Streptobacillus felis TaxID=1384509 RepID=A0A7Z0TA52_9FUSO|nr:TIGR00730 family Rossman fold protein [Streptobacillus felis]NYV27622.1 TIGR00730 family Rossman fold protein [Streptobacillus felis]
MKISVYCGASVGNNEKFSLEVIKLGKLIAKTNNTLVYGAGKIGLMGLVADACLSLSGKVIGIMPKFLVDREIAHTEITELIVVNTMSERKKLLFESDIYISLPGGPGTLEEFSEGFSSIRLGISNARCILLNIDGYYNDFVSYLDKMVVNGFLTQKDRNIVEVYNSVEELEKNL